MKKKSGDGDEAPPGPSPNRASQGPDTDLFHQWVAEELRKKYDPVLNEPVPDDLLALLKPPPPKK